MNRTIRRNRRLTAMEKTIVRMNKKIKDLRYSDPKREQLNAQREYIAQQIADASYTIYWAKFDHAFAKSLQQRVEVLTNAYGHHLYLAQDIQRLADSNRRLNMQNTRNIWLAD